MASPISTLDWPTSKEAWLKKIEQDLKGAALEDLNWHLSDDLIQPPFYHPDDQISNSGPLMDRLSDNDWCIGDYLHVGHDLSKANEDLLEGLSAGVEVPCIILDGPINEEEIGQLMKEVKPEMISTHFVLNYPEKNPTRFFKDWISWLRSRNADISKIKGCIDFDPLLDWADTPPMEDLLRLLRLAHRHLPHFQVLQINGGPYHGGPQRVLSELGHILARGAAYLNILRDEGIEPSAVHNQILLSVSVSTSYFVEIAKLRALKILWANLLDGFGLPPDELPTIEVHFSQESASDSMNDNYIHAATQAMSAVLGGADILYIRPANEDHGEQGTSFTRRIARNVQHLLKMESHFDRVADPSAGSYYIESLTHKLVEGGWKEFQRLEAAREFYP